MPPAGPSFLPQLEKLGVKVITGAKVEKVDADGVIIGGKRIASATAIWTANVVPSPIVKTLAAPADRAGRICVGPNLNIPASPGCSSSGTPRPSWKGRPLPGVAQAAIQQERYVSNWIARDLAGRPTTRPFHYHDKGTMAVVGKNFAILQTHRLRLHGSLSQMRLRAVVHTIRPIFRPPLAVVAPGHEQPIPIFQQLAPK